VSPHATIDDLILLLLFRRAAAAQRDWAGKVEALRDDEIVVRHVRVRDWVGTAAKAVPAAARRDR
jgi:hypothetical protein